MAPTVQRASAANIPLGGRIYSQSSNCILPHGSIIEAAQPSHHYVVIILVRQISLFTCQRATFKFNSHFLLAARKGFYSSEAFLAGFGPES